MGEATGTLPAGFQFGSYVIGGCIGHGGMARIYRAEHRALRKPVALKVMDGALLDRPDGRPRFLREGQSAAAVKHPNVVDITDVGVWQGRPYLVMELLEGEDLEQYLTRHKPLAETEVVRLMIPVIAGLATAHACGVIHRDLKPSNIFLAHGPDGEIVPKLLDFGISKLANALSTLDPSTTPVGELMGSPMYMSPEAVRGARDLTPQSDQYSLGVVLYESVTGRPPFYGDSLLGVLEAVAQGRFESPRKYRPDLSKTLEVAILRAMRREPRDRFSNVRELGRALCDAADHRTRLLWTPSFGLRDVPTFQDAPSQRTPTERHATQPSGPPLEGATGPEPRAGARESSPGTAGPEYGEASRGPRAAALSSPRTTGSPLSKSVLGSVFGGGVFGGSMFGGSVLGGARGRSFAQKALIALGALAAGLVMYLAMRIEGPRGEALRVRAVAPATVSTPRVAVPEAQPSSPRLDSEMSSLRGVAEVNPIQPVVGAVAPEPAIGAPGPAEAPRARARRTRAAPVSRTPAVSAVGLAGSLPITPATVRPAPSNSDGAALRERATQATEPEMPSQPPEARPMPPRAAPALGANQSPILD